MLSCRNELINIEYMVKTSPNSYLDTCFGLRSSVFRLVNKRNKSYGHHCV